MRIKRLYLLNAILAIVLLTSLLVNAATYRSIEQPIGEYDPWLDTNDDGIIDIFDIVALGISFGSKGTPINKTDLLLKLQARVDSLNASLIEHQARINILNASNIELQSRMNSLNASLLDLKAYLMTRIVTLETDLAALQSRIGTLEDRAATLETELLILNATKMRKAPDWDSGWIPLTVGNHNISHPLGTTDLLIYILGKDVDGTYDIHQLDFGSDQFSSQAWGMCWFNLTEKYLIVRREANDTNWDEIRIMIWKIPES